MTYDLTARLGLAASRQAQAAQLGRVALFGLVSVPFGILTALRNEPLRSRPTQADETFWIVPEISYGPTDDMTTP